MAKKEKVFRPYRDKYIITFNDENNEEKWTVGNLRKFLRHLFTDNEVLRELNTEVKTAEEFSMRMGSNIAKVLQSAERNHGKNVANFSLVPWSAGSNYRISCGGTITRLRLSRFKGLQAQGTN